MNMFWEKWVTNRQNWTGSNDTVRNSFLKTCQLLKCT